VVKDQIVSLAATTFCYSHHRLLSPLIHCPCYHLSLYFSITNGLMEENVSDYAILEIIFSTKRYFRLHNLKVKKLILNCGKTLKLHGLKCFL